MPNNTIHKTALIAVLEDSLPQLTNLQRILGLVLMPILYYAGAMFANQFTVFTRGSVIIWPPNSVLLAALLIHGRRDYPLLIFGAIAAEIAGDLPFISFHEGLLFGIGNVVEVAVAMVLLKLWRFDRHFKTVDDVLKFIFCALGMGALVGAVVGASLHTYFHSTDSSYLEHIRLLWFGDALGLMIFTPLWLSFWPFEGRKKTESVALTYPYDLVTGVAALGMLMVFIASRDGEFMGVHIGPNLLLPFVVYGGARFGTRWASIGSAVVTFITIIMMDKGFNPFGALTTRESVIQAQEFTFIMSVVALGSAALFSRLRTQQTELEIANHSLNELNSSLESRVSRRTQELQQANAKLEREVGEREETERALHAANRELQRLAGVDGLTGVANRRAFDSFLEVEWKRSARENKALSLILFDIDFFKRFNDHYGHPAGDACLIQIATATMEAVKRPSDLVARYGGEEFAVILPETDRAGALTVMEQICATIEKQAIAHERSDACGTVTISAGVATHTATQQETTEIILNLADKALYRAKSQGRNQFVFEPITLSRS